MSDSKRGYIYVLVNPCIPNLVKIGRSKNGGQARANNIYQTGVPAPFSVHFEMIFEDAIAAESLIHSRLSEHRYSKSREFFQISPQEAATKIVRAWAEENGLYLHSPSEALCVWESENLANRLGVDPVHVALRLKNVTEDVLFPDLIGKGAQYFYDNLPELSH